MRTFAGMKFSTLALLALCAAGCGGSGPDFGEVQGKVTIDGQPVEGLEITFDPQFTGGSPSLGTTDAQGNYWARFSISRDGAWVGKHTLRINGVTYNDSGAEIILAKIPAEYGDESQQEFEVKPGSNTFNLDVKTK